MKEIHMLSDKYLENDACLLLCNTRFTSIHRRIHTDTYVNRYAGYRICLVLDGVTDVSRTLPESIESIMHKHTHVPV